MKNNAAGVLQTEQGGVDFGFGNVRERAVESWRGDQESFVGFEVGDGGENVVVQGNGEPW